MNKKFILCALLLGSVYQCNFAMEKDDMDIVQDEPMDAQESLSYYSFEALPKELHGEIIAAIAGSSNAQEALKTLKKFQMTNKNMQKHLQDDAVILELAKALKQKTGNIFGSLYLLKAYKLISREQYKILRHSLKSPYQKEVEAYKKNAFLLTEKAAHGEYDAVKTLLDQGVSPNDYYYGQDETLLGALKSKSTKVMELLLNHPDLRITNPEIVASVFAGTLFEPVNLVALKMLLTKYPTIDINATYPSGANAIGSAIQENNIEYVKFLLEQPSFDVNNEVVIYIPGTPEDSGTPLMLAAQKGNAEIIKLLLQQPKINILKRSSQGKRASDFAQTDEIKQLISDAEQVQYDTLKKLMAEWGKK